MAKGNMLQGMARGKVGDVVFSRLNGEQIARVRNRNPKNPRTNAQLYQRAIMATVMAAYSAGKVIFDHSFQGYAVGEANQRRFMAENAKRLRTLLAADLAKDEISSRSICAFNAPGVNSVAPALIKVSEGSYQNSAFDIISLGMIEPNNGETVAQYASRLNLIAGDIYTIVGFGRQATTTPLFVVRNDVTGNQSNPYKQFPAGFFYARLQVKDGLLSNNTEVTSSTKLSVLFDCTDSFNCVPGDLNGDGQVLHTSGTTSWVAEAMLPTLYARVAAVIRSRKDQDLRSTSFMESAESEETYTPLVMDGISAEHLLAAWKQGAESIGDSDLILEGGDS